MSEHYNDWLNKAGELIQSTTDSDTVECLTGDATSWERRVLRIPVIEDHPIVLSARRSVGANGQLQELRSIIALTERDGIGIRISTLHYLPEGYIGGSLKYTPEGLPEIADVVVEPGFDAQRPSKARPRITRYLTPQGYKDYISHIDGDQTPVRTLVKLPKKWLRKDNEVKLKVELKAKDDSWVIQQLVYPSKLRLEDLVTQKDKLFLP